ncbi:MAG: glycosyltransferase [Nitrospirae bacterium]|nr:glycosyltransferase [Nitrospirota bacterium]
MPPNVLLAGARWYGRTTDFVRRALRDAGCKVHTFYYRVQHDSGLAPARWRSESNDRLLGAARRWRPELVLLLKGEFLSAGSVAALRGMGITMASWWFDDPRPWTDYWSAGRTLDHVFIFDRAYVPWLRRVSKGRVSYLPLGFDPDSYRPVTNSVRPRWDVTFVGTPYPNRVRLLSGLSSFRLRLVGPGWRRHPELVWASIDERPTLRPSQVRRLYAQSAMVLNIHHPQSITAPNQRVFELAGSAAFQLTDHKSALREFFALGEEIVTYRGPRDLERKLAYYLKHPKERRAIAAKACRRAHAEHTYAHRVQELLSRTGC